MIGVRGLLNTNPTNNEARPILLKPKQFFCLRVVSRKPLVSTVHSRKLTRITYLNENRNSSKTSFLTEATKYKPENLNVVGEMLVSNDLRVGNVSLCRWDVTQCILTNFYILIFHL